MRLTVLFIAISLALGLSAGFANAQALVKTEGSFTDSDKQQISAVANSCEASRIQNKIARIDQDFYQMFMIDCVNDLLGHTHIFFVGSFRPGDLPLVTRHETTKEALSVCGAYAMEHGSRAPVMFDYAFGIYEASNDGAKCLAAEIAH